MPETPILSIAIPVREAANTIRATLESLLPQCDPEKVEVVAAVWRGDPSYPVLREFKDRNGFRILAVSTRAGVPQLRRAAVLETRAPWIAITEDHCLFHSRWVSALLAHTVPGSRDIVGGPVSNAHLTLLGWALYFNRYSSFLPSLKPASAAKRETCKLPGNSACYPREAIFSCADTWREGFWEVEVNEALAARGHRFFCSPELQVAQNQRRGLLQYTRLRFRHARIFGAQRALLLPWWGRLFAIVRSPFTPLVLLTRATRAVFSSGLHREWFLLASPLLAVYYSAWAAGEACGYAWGAGGATTESD